MTVRPLRPDDLDAVRALMAENAMLLDGVAYDDFTGVLVAEIEGNVVGMIQALVGKPYAVVTEIAVDRKYQEVGVGVALIQSMELLLRCSGVAAWVAITGETNETINAKLDAYGARCTGRGVAWLKAC